MGMNKEEQLNRYFEHAMSSKEEQNFLISVAASDEMRIAFRSQLELMKAVRHDKDALRSVAQIRNRTLTALGLSATAVTPFIEHELMRDAASKEQVVSAGISSPIATAVRAPWFSRALSLLRHPILTLTAGLAIGVSSTAIVMDKVADVKTGSAITAAAPASTVIPKTTHHKAAVRETIPTTNNLNNSGRSASLANSVTQTRHAMKDVSVGEKEHAISSSSNVVSHPTQPVDASQTVGVTATIPEKTVSGSATMHSNKATITRATDSLQAK